MLSIRLAVIEDIPAIMNFIDEHWRKGESLAVNREFFDWSFVRNDKVNMIIGVDDDTHTIFGIYGFFPYTDDDKPDCAGAIWKTIRSEDSMLGVHMVDFLHSLPIRYFAGAGLRKRAIRMAELNGVKVLSMDHYYRINRNIRKEDFEIAIISDDRTLPFKKSGYRIEKLESIDDFARRIPEQILKDSIFRKDYSYIERRYYKHPVYKYELYGIHIDETGCDSVLVLRTESWKSACSCKIIDYFGDHKNLAYLGEIADSLMEERGFEFIDVYSYGVDTALYEQSGFSRCEPESVNIIPNYFQPLVQSNIEIYLRQPGFDGLVLFRGDGDQDRPI